MLEVKNRQVWCPRFDQLVVRPCPTPPPRKEVQAALIGILEGGVEHLTTEDERVIYRRLIHWLKTKDADREWLLITLSTLNSDHALFAKGYRP